MSLPVDTKLYEKVKSEAKKKFARYPSAYASGWIVKTYKSRGGRYERRMSRSGQKQHGLKRWYSEKWIDVCQLPKIVQCGRLRRSKSKSYPYCRPLRRITNGTPRTVGEFSQKELKRRCSMKQKAKTRMLIFDRGARRKTKVQ